jgi:hypothetical protein
MKKALKDNLFYIIFLVLTGLIGGVFTAFYIIESTDPALMAEMLAQIGGKNAYVVVNTLQVVSYSLIFGLLGKLISKKAGLWKEVKLEGKKVLKNAAIGFIGGVVIMLLDLFVFSAGADGEAIKSSLISSLSINSIMASFTYGGIVEELMMRLFLMSLIALILWKIFCRKESIVPTKILVIANILVAIAFAAAHLPATAMTMGLTPMIVLRCFVLNGSMGLVFGRAYRKDGIAYAMLSHIFAHVGMKLLGLVVILL